MLRCGVCGRSAFDVRLTLTRGTDGICDDCAAPAERFTCPVCGFPALYEPPRSPKTDGGSYEICPSCGFQFGVSDDDGGYSYRAWREEWIQAGMPWRSVGQKPPPTWNPVQQLEGLPHGDN